MSTKSHDLRAKTPSYETIKTSLALNKTLSVADQVSEKFQQY